MKISKFSFYWKIRNIRNTNMRFPDNSFFSKNFSFYICVVREVIQWCRARSECWELHPTQLLSIQQASSFRVTNWSDYLPALMRWEAERCWLITRVLTRGRARAGQRIRINQVIESSTLLAHWTSSFSPQLSRRETKKILHRCFWMLRFNLYWNNISLLNCSIIPPTLRKFEQIKMLNRTWRTKIFLVPFFFIHFRTDR